MPEWYSTISVAAGWVAGLATFLSSWALASAHGRRPWMSALGWAPAALGGLFIGVLTAAFLAAIFVSLAMILILWAGALWPRQKI